MKKILSIGFVLIMTVGLAGCNETQTHILREKEKDKKIAENTDRVHDEMFSKNKPNPRIALMALDGSDLAKQLKFSGSPEFGCSDFITYKNIKKNLNAKQILEKLFTFDDFDQDSGTYNVFSSSNNLKVEDLMINNNGLVTVKLSGELQTGGMCDDPRVLAQIKSTVKLLEPMFIKDVEVYINNKSLNDYLSVR